MQLKTLFKWLLIVAGIVGVAILAIVFFYPKKNLPVIIPVPQNALYNKLIESIKETIFKDQTNSGLPIRFKIPSINVDAHIEYVGLTSDGSMDVPKGPIDVAWFDLGPRPGDTGSAVIAGHYGPWKSGAKSVFDDINKLKQGDKIYVEDGNGVTTTFAVRESRAYDPKANASDVFGSNDGKAHLNLITCEGVWSGAKKTYSNRLVIFADKE